MDKRIYIKIKKTFKKFTLTKGTTKKVYQVTTIDLYDKLTTHNLEFSWLEFSFFFGLLIRPELILITSVFLLNSFPFYVHYLTIF